VQLDYLFLFLSGTTRRLFLKLKKVQKEMQVSPSMASADEATVTVRPSRPVCCAVNGVRQVSASGGV